MRRTIKPRSTREYIDIRIGQLKEDRDRAEGMDYLWYQRLIEELEYVSHIDQNNSLDKGLCSWLKYSMINATEQESEDWPNELESMLIQGWCSCPECDETFLDWQEFVLHAYPCVHNVEAPLG